MTRESLAVAIEALSWMAYAGMGERSALFKAADELGVKRSDELRQAHRLVMETTRFQNRLNRIVSSAVGEETVGKTQHGIVSFLEILAYLTYIRKASEKELKRTVTWARQSLGWKELHPFEEAIAGIVSGREQIYEEGMDEIERLSLETCNPKWFVKRVIGAFGRPFALRILQRNLQPSPAYVRINSLKVVDQARKEDIIRQMGGCEIQSVDDVWRLDTIGSRLVRSRLFASGEIVVQDLASVVASLVASPEPGHVVLDLCAAPGNKTSHLAALMKNDGEIYSIDISDKRLLHWKREMERTGTSIAVALRADAKRIPLELEANVVLVDPPCSNTGVFSRNPAIKWKITPSRVSEFALRQLSILRAAAPHVAPGGFLVYCTCSILPEEDESVLETFVRETPNFRATRQTPFLGSPGLKGFEMCQRFYSHLHDCNGYFIAKLRRDD